MIKDFLSTQLMFPLKNSQFPEKKNVGENNVYILLFLG